MTDEQKAARDARELRVKRETHTICESCDFISYLEQLERHDNKCPVCERTEHRLASVNDLKKQWPYSMFLNPAKKTKPQKAKKKTFSDMSEDEAFEFMAAKEKAAAH